MPNVERLKMIQSVIDRMSRASFSLKGWSVTVAVALLGFSAKDSDRAFALLAIYAIIAFAGLDAYYLALERIYRTFYAQAVTEPDTEWGMKAGPPTAADLVQALMRPAVWVLHGTVLVVAVVVLLSAD